MDYKNRINGKPDYVGNTLVALKNSTMEVLQCSLYLPDRIYQKPLIEILTSTKIFHNLKDGYDFELKIEIKNSYGYEKVVIKAPNLYILGAHSINGSQDLEFGYRLIYEPQDLQIIKYLQFDEIEKVQIDYLISENVFLNPLMSNTYSFLGDVNVERVENFCTTLLDDSKLFFDKHYRHKLEENGDFLQWSYIVAQAELETDSIKNILDKQLPLVNDFLDLISFITRKRTACLGVNFTFDNCTVEYYRGNYSFPISNKEHSYLDGLIPRDSLKEFIQSCYESYAQNPNLNSIKHAIYTTFNEKDDSINSIFLKLFSGLETLILNYRRDNSLEFNLEPKEWLELKKQIKKSIKNCGNNNIDSIKRSRIYSKLDELNRISLKEAFEEFGIFYNLNLEDLWPVFKGSIGLSQIRNILIHGESIPDDVIISVSFASYHLRVILERCLLSVLGWSPNKSSIKFGEVRGEFMLDNEITINQKIISNYFKYKSK